MTFDLDTRQMGISPLVVAFEKQFGDQSGTLPLLCWQNPVSSVLLFAGDARNVIAMSLSIRCAKYDNRLSKQ
jgi:hypothetical protein